MKNENTNIEIIAPSKEDMKELEKQRKEEKKLKDELVYNLFIEYIKDNLSYSTKDGMDITLFTLPKFIKVWPVVPDSEHSYLGSLDMENTEFLNFTKDKGLEISTGGDWQDSWYVQIKYDMDKNSIYIADFKPMEMVKDKFKSADKKKRMSMKEFKELVLTNDIVVQIDVIEEKAESASQQRLFGMVVAYKKGELDTSKMNKDLVKKIKDIAKDIDLEDAEDYAKTKTKGLPNRVKENYIVSFDKFNA